MTSPPVETRCKCGHTREQHAEDGEGACSRCPSSAIWVDSLVDWVYPCSRYQRR